MKNPVTSPLNFGRKALLGALGVAAVFLPLFAGVVYGTALRSAPKFEIVCQSPGATPRFEVASVRPVELLDERSIMAARIRDRMFDVVRPAGTIRIRGRRLWIRNYNLKQLICTAYRIPVRQLVGPEWLSEKRFNIEALLPPDAPASQANEMLQALLQERFGLRVHRTTREEAGYILSVAKGGPNLKVSSPALSAQGSPGASVPVSAERLANRQPRPSGSAGYELKRYSIDALAETLAIELQSPVEDRTGLKGLYDLAIDIQPPVDDNDRDVQPRVADAVKKLGLDLKRGKVTLQVLVVDSVQKTPTPN